MIAQPAQVSPQGAIQQQKPQVMHPAVIVLITIGVVIALGMGGCMLCVCVSAAQNS